MRGQPPPHAYAASRRCQRVYDLVRLVAAGSRVVVRYLSRRFVIQGRGASGALFDGRP